MVEAEPLGATFRAGRKAHFPRGCKFQRFSQAFCKERI
jgi:hypothetical protein